MARYAITRALEIISEASRGLSDELKAEHPDVDWRGVAALGNVLRHGYREVEDKIIWNIVRKDLGLLRDAVASEIAPPSDEKSDAET